NAYARVVTEAGNLPAQALIERVFENCDRKWRGIGVIPDSGWRLRAAFAGAAFPRNSARFSYMLRASARIGFAP
ncbi:MAG: hypothetical protein Q8O54_10870, partial [Brevundimonas sp.]|nr:hypothetical protein [Brevundimonas sp.]